MIIIIPFLIKKYKQYAMNYIKLYEEYSKDFVENSIDKENDIDFLKQLISYIDDDIERLTNNKDNFKLMARMNKMPLEEYINLRLKDCVKRKELALKKLKRLEGE